MSRIADTRSMGRSALVPFDPNETPQQRHARRLREAVAAKRFIEDWCILQDVTLSVSNDNHHWRFQRAGQKRPLVEWWPSSAKCVVSKQWYRGTHCHDHLQLVQILTRTFTNPQTPEKGSGKEAHRNTTR